MPQKQTISRPNPRPNPRITPRTAYAYTPEEAAQELRVCRLTIYKWLRSGYLPGWRVGPKLWRISRHDIERLAAQSEERAS